MLVRVLGRELLAHLHSFSSYSNQLKVRRPVEPGSRAHFSSSCFPPALQLLPQYVCVCVCVFVCVRVCVCVCV